MKKTPTFISLMIIIAIITVTLLSSSCSIEPGKVASATINETTILDQNATLKAPLYTEDLPVETFSQAKLTEKNVIAETTENFEDVDFSSYYYDRGIEGWVYIESIKVLKYPQKGSSVITTLNSTQLVNIIGEFPGWYILSVDDSIGFIPTKSGAYNTVIEKVDFEMSKDVSGPKTFIGRASTTAGSTDDNRASNLAVSAASTSIVVPSGGVFSLNQATGPRTSSAGYKKASIFQNGTVTSGIGGGVCQTSTTIHCSVLNAIENKYDLEVLEASKHSLDVTYVDSEEKEAMVNWGTNDFRFKNNTGKDIAIVVTSKGQTVTSEIYIIN